jgi:hypothetical protein
MTVRLRPHHLLCMLTYVGKGYSEAFVANYDAVAKRLSDGEDILVVDGPDDLCAPLLHEADAHCREQSVVERDRQAALDIGTLLATPIGAESRLQFGRTGLIAMREAFSRGETRRACLGCQWADLCDAVAGRHYRDTRLHRDTA